MSWDDILDITSLALLVLAGALALVAGIGLLRLPDTLSRLHAATKPQVLGLVFVVIALALQSRSWGALLVLAPILVFQMLTAPIAAHMVGRAAYRNGSIEPRVTPIDELAPAVAEASKEHGA
jgi:multicomponent Na+:H+ antiporter subunit G